MVGSIRFFVEWQVTENRILAFVAYFPPVTLIDVYCACDVPNIYGIQCELESWYRGQFEDDE